VRAATRAAATAKEIAMITPHQRGHIVARDGSLLRVDVMGGRWVATRYTPSLLVTQRVVGTDDAAQRQVARWF
jgi:hypothetical protein